MSRLSAKCTTHTVMFHLHIISSSPVWTSYSLFLKQACDSRTLVHPWFFKIAFVWGIKRFSARFLDINLLKLLAFYVYVMYTYCSIFLHLECECQRKQYVSSGRLNYQSEGGPQFGYLKTMKFTFDRYAM